MSEEIPSTTCASVTRKPVGEGVVALIKSFESKFDVKVFCIIHPADGGERLDGFCPALFDEVLGQLQSIERGKPIAVLLDSPGGDMASAFRIAKAIQKHCSKYYVFIPRMASSAATTFALGASRIYFGDHAEIGPIDTQVSSPEHGRKISSLEMVTSITRINAEALNFLETALARLKRQTSMDADCLIPHAMKYATDLVRPIMERVDSVTFAFHCRLLKTAELYAKTLLLSRGDSEEDADRISANLARGYQDHAFVIDFVEARRIGLDVLPLPDDLLFNPCIFSNAKSSTIGFLEVCHECNRPPSPGEGKSTE